MPVTLGLGDRGHLPLDLLRPGTARAPFTGPVGHVTESKRYYSHAFQVRWPEIAADTRGDDTGDRDPELKHSGIWRQEVFARARRLEVALPQAKDAADAKDLLKVARETAEKSIGPFTWWNGTLEERAWLALHDAEVALLRAMKDKAAISWWECATGRIKPQIGAPPGTQTAVLPTTATEAADSLRSYYDWSDRLFAETRALRNRLICLTAAGLATTALLLIAGIVGWLQIKSGQAAIVSGTEQFLLVALFGAIGAFIIGVPKLSAVVRRTRPVPTSWH